MNKEINKELEKVAEIALYVWQKNWVEHYGGNITLDLTEYAHTLMLKNTANFKPVALKSSFPSLNGHIYYTTGSGKRMRDVAKSPLDFGSIIRITSRGEKYEILSSTNIAPTSELITHLSIYSYFNLKKVKHKAILHAHPSELVALSHIPEFKDSRHLTKTIWSMIPEARILIPQGIGVVPYKLTGSQELAEATIKELENSSVLLWEKHGIIATAPDISECFDLVEVLVKSADIYLKARNAGYEAEGLSDEQLDEIVRAFKLPSNQ